MRVRAIIVLLPSPFMSMNEIHHEFKEELCEFGWNEWSLIDTLIVYALAWSSMIELIRDIIASNT